MKTKKAKKFSFWRKVLGEKRMKNILRNNLHLVGELMEEGIEKVSISDVYVEALVVNILKSSSDFAIAAIDVHLDDIKENKKQLLEKIEIFVRSLYDGIAKPSNDELKKIIKEQGLESISVVVAQFIDFVEEKIYAAIDKIDSNV